MCARHIFKGRDVKRISSACGERMPWHRLLSETRIRLSSDLLDLPHLLYSSPLLVLLRILVICLLQCKEIWRKENFQDGIHRLSIVRTPSLLYPIYSQWRDPFFYWVNHKYGFLHLQHFSIPWRRASRIFISSCRRDIGCFCLCWSYFCASCHQMVHNFILKFIMHLIEGLIFFPKRSSCRNSKAFELSRRSSSLLSLFC